MQVTEQMKLDLAKLIVQSLQKEFQIVHYTGNLMNTIKIIETENGVAVEIPAERYLFSTYRKKGVIIPYGFGGSYASEIDETGGFSGKHKGYVERCIDEAIARWMLKYQISGRIK